MNTSEATNQKLYSWKYHKNTSKDRSLLWMNTLFKGPKTLILGSQQVKELLCFYVLQFTVKPQQEKKEIEINLDKALSGNKVKELHGEI